VPLTAEQMQEIRSWEVSGPMDLFIKSTVGRRYSANHLNSRWNRWRTSLDAAPIRHLKLTIHGLRATAVADRRRQGGEDGAIADELGMSVQMVARYTRFADKEASARASRDRREARLRNKTGLDM
jgi:integrase